MGNSASSALHLLLYDRRKQYMNFLENQKCLDELDRISDNIKKLITEEADALYSKNSLLRDRLSNIRALTDGVKDDD